MRSFKIPPDVLQDIKDLNIDKALARARSNADLAGLPRHLIPGQTEEFYREQMLGGMHKIRASAPEGYFTPEERAASVKWCLERGWKPGLKFLEGFLG